MHTPPLGWLRLTDFVAGGSGTKKSAATGKLSLSWCIRRLLLTAKVSRWYWC